MLMVAPRNAALEPRLLGPGKNCRKRQGMPNGGKSVGKLIVLYQ
jgi:hypothetical protein